MASLDDERDEADGVEEQSKPERHRLTEESLNTEAVPPTDESKPQAPVPTRLKGKPSPAPKAKARPKARPKAKPKRKAPEAPKVPPAVARTPPVVEPPPTPQKTNPQPAAPLAAGHLSEAQSVLARIEEVAGELPRVMLQDVPSEPSPLVLTGPRTAPSDRALDHYDIVGEIGRGGVGVILKGRDVDLGRDVAIKVLREDMADRPELAQRFVEEAQISGQLQHPGIAPLYELGVHPDGRPYFAMKLIKGRTLAGLLNDRSDVTKDRHRFIGIFEQVCQAMAYAHSRGVIHRDIKPSNIMVGAFAEVQVMDWGFAKVLNRGGVADERDARRLQSVVSIIETVRSRGDEFGSQSLAGSLMGTPPYMPPEQASGNVEMVDARSDVFALGAVLCEILTGKPPYVTETAEGGVYEIVQQASRALLTPARQRLDECGADEELIRICKDCLVPAQAARPADAGVLAGEVTNYLAAVEDRARKAQLAAVAERGKAATAQAKAKAAAASAEHERRARRLTLALGTAVLAVVLLGGGGFYVFQSQKKAREAETARSVSTALEEAVRLSGLAKADTLGDFTHWAAALTAAKQAQEVAASGDDELMARANATLEEVQAGESLARAQAAQAERDKAMAAQLEDIRSQKGDDFRPLRSEEQYAAAFRVYGLDVDHGTTTDLGEQIAASAIAPELIAALDEWAYVRRTYATVSSALARRPSDLAQTADEDPWRKVLRQAIQRGDTSRLKDLSGSGDVAALGVTSVQLLASALANAGNLDLAVAFLQKAQHYHSQDFWINFYLGYWLTQVSPPRWEESARAYSAAVAVRPAHAPAWNNFAIALQSRGAFEDALAAYGRAIELRPDYASAHNNLGTAYAELGKPKQALASFRAAVEAEADHALAYFGIGVTLEKLGQNDEAIEAFQKALTYRPDLHEAHDALATLLRAAGREGDVLSAAKRTLDANPDASWAHRNYAFALWSQGEGDKALGHYEKAIKLDPKDAVSQHDYGIALARTKADWDAAIAAIEAACALEPNDAGFRASLGWALEQSGDLGNAIAEFRAAVALDPKLFLAHDQLATLLLRAGDLQGAVFSIVDSIMADVNSTSGYVRLGDLLGAYQTREQAELTYDQLVRGGTVGGRVAFQRSLALALVNYKRDNTGAVEALQNAIALDSFDPGLRELEGRLLEFVIHDLDGAMASYRKAIELKGDYANAYCRLGFVLQKMGRFRDALESIRKGHKFGTAAGWTEPSDAWVEEAEKYLQIHGDLDAYSSGEKKPASAADALMLTTVCRYTERWGSAARAFKELLVREDLGDLDEGDRSTLLYNAACAAVRAGTEATRGNDAQRPDEEARAGWRAQALEWLRTTLQDRVAKIEAAAATMDRLKDASSDEEKAEAAAAAEQKGKLLGELRHWTEDPDLEKIRDPKRVETLDAAEQAALNGFWEAVLAALSG